MAVLWLSDISAADLEQVGGKAASLGELTLDGLPVPPGFVVTADTYRTFLEDTGIDEKLEQTLDVDLEDSRALSNAAEQARSLVARAEVPPAIREEILATYGEIGDSVPVAVRSSATAEDLPDASFAGQQETYLNIEGPDLVERVQQCWASLFTDRAIYYRQEQGYSHADIDIGVVVQQMVVSEKSGVLFTSHPSSGAAQTVIEASWGLGEAVVSGAVTPDNYVVDRTDRSVINETVAEKTVMHVRDPESGETVERSVPDDKRTERVLTDDEIDELVAIGEEIEDHYGAPQDVEWAIQDGNVYLLQSRPVTTIDEEAATADGGATTVDEPSDDGPLVSGLGAGPGVATGRARIVNKLDQLDKVDDGDIIVTEMTTPDMVTAMKRADGLVTDEGGMTSHAAIVSRELGVPAVVGSTDATQIIEDGQQIRIDGEIGQVIEASADESYDTAGKERKPELTDEPRDGRRRPAQDTQPKPMTATEVKVNISIPEAAERAAETGADGVGLLRTEHMIVSTNKTPRRYIDDHGADAYVRELIDGIQTVAESFYPRSVRVRTLDAPTDEFRQLEGGEDEPHEHNPMLGYRGIRRSVDETDIFQHELSAFRRLYEMGYDNIEVMFPMVTDAEDVLAARRHLEDAGIDPTERTWGVMIETPASALSIESICETGIDFVSFGTNDLTQYTLAVDRNNEQVADRFDELHPAVLELISRVIDVCRDHDVNTSICGQAGSKPRMVRSLVTDGVKSLSVNIDAVHDVQHEVMRVEQRCLLESIRE